MLELDPNILFTYQTGFVENPDQVFKDLCEQIDWEHRETARSEYFSSDFPDPYSYGNGDGRRTYLPRPYHPHVLAIREKLEKETGFVYEVCFLNYYKDGHDFLGWHADDSPEMDDARPIVTLSLGAEREIWFCPQEDKNDKTVMKLAHGSICVMHPGVQDTHFHRIPKASFICGPRISLVFRGYIRASGTP